MKLLRYLKTIFKLTNLFDWFILFMGFLRRSNQLILKEINPDCSLEGLMMMLKLQYSGHVIQRVDSLEKIPMLGKIEGRRRREQQRMRQLDDISNSMNMSLSKTWASL